MTDSISPKREETKTLEDTTRKDVLQDTLRKMLTGSNDTDKLANDKVGHAQSTNKVLSSQVLVRVSREMIMSWDKVNDQQKSRLTLRKDTDDTPTRNDHSTINIIDPGGELCARSEVLSKGIDDLNIHQVLNQRPEHITSHRLKQPTKISKGGK